MSKPSCNKAALMWDGHEISCSPEETPAPPFPPLIVCRDCGCAFGMKSPVRLPDFSQLTSKGFELEIFAPNSQNVTYFNFWSNKSRPKNCAPDKVPPKACCTCPLCRPNNRPGYHFRDCTCLLCVARRNGCKNRYRFELLAKLRQTRCCSFQLSNDVDQQNTNRSLPGLPSKLCHYCDEDDDFVPRNRSPHCSCHAYVPVNWIVKDPCPVRGTGIPRSRISQVSLQMLHGVEIEPIKTFTTTSLSQQEWPIESNCICQTGVEYFGECQPPRCSLGAVKGRRIFEKSKLVFQWCKIDKMIKEREGLKNAEPNENDEANPKIEVKK